MCKYQHFAPCDEKHQRNGLPTTPNISVFDLFVNIFNFCTIFYIKYVMIFICIVTFVLIKIFALTNPAFKLLKMLHN